MSQAIRLLVGLGNPGKSYQDTRHNAGYWWLERLAESYRTEFKLQNSYKALIAPLTPNNHSAWLLKSTQYMNESGYAVASFCRYHQIQPEQILVAHDELDFPAGEAKFKLGGGHGGHNGLRDIIQHLNSRDFYRFRIGIGHPGHRDLVHDYVLTKPSVDARNKIIAVIDESLAQLPDVLSGDMQRVMQIFHTKNSD